MPAIGRRSTKPLNDPPRRSGATATLFQSRKSSCVSPAPYALAPISDAKLPHFSILTGRPMYRRSRAYGNTIVNGISSMAFPIV